MRRSDSRSLGRKNSEVLIATGIAFCLGLGHVGWAGDLGSTKITAVRNMVEHNDGQNKKNADVGQTVTQGQSVSTKEQALAELVADDSSVIRLGANSVFSYNSKERMVKLDKGTMLMHTPPGNGGATIDSGGVVGAISGTTFMLTASPAKCSKCGQELQIGPNGKIVCRDHPDLPPSTSGFALIVLEGGSVTKVTGADGQTVEIMPGQMAVVGPKGSGAPKVYAVNVAQIARTSPLINAFPNPLPSFPKIVSTAYGLQGYNPNPTGTSAVALGSNGQLLTAVSPLPNPFQISFPMAVNQPGQNNFINNGNLGNIATAAGGGGGGPVTPTGVAGGGGGPAGPSIPVIPIVPIIPASIGQNPIGANGLNPSSPPTPTPPVVNNPIIPLTVGGAIVTSKIYDGTASASIVGAFLQGAVVSGVALANETSGFFASKNVGSGIFVTTSMSLTGPDAAKYTLTGQPTLTGTITAKALTMTGTSVAPTKVYDGTVSAVVTVGTQSGEVVGEVLGTTTAVGSYANRNVGTGKSVTAVYTLADGVNPLHLASNYSLANDTLSADITAKDLVVDVSGVTISKVYDGLLGATFTGATLNSEVAGTGTTSDGKYYTLDTVTLKDGGVGTFASKNVGTGKSVTTTITLTGSGAGNYTLLNQPSLTGTITAKDLVVDVSGVTISKVYDGLLGATFTGATLNSEATGTGNSTDGKYYTLDTVTLKDGGVGTFASKNVGAAISVTTGMSLDGVDKGNYTLTAQPTLTGTITAKALTMTGTSVAPTKVYDGTVSAVVTVGTQSGEVVGEVLGTTTAVGSYANRNVGTGKSVTAVYTLADGVNPLHLASNYSLANDTLSADITAKDLVVDVSGVTISKVYDGLVGATFTGATLNSEAAGTGTTSDGKYYTLDTVTLKDGGVGTFASKNVGTGITVTSGMSLDGADKGNYTLNAQPTLTGAITVKALTMTGSSAGNKVYDGTVTAVVSLGTQSGEVVGEVLGTTTAVGSYANRNVGTGKSVTAVYTLADGVNPLHLASNYSLANDTLSADITAKALTISGATVTTKAYDGTAVATITGAGLQAAIAAGTGSSTDGKPYSVDSVTLSGGNTGTFERYLPGTMIPVSTTMSVTGTGSGNYTVTQPTGLKGEITGSATLNRNGAAISVASTPDIHIRNTTATRMQDGLTISSATGSVLLENSSFDGWMQRSTPNQTVDDGGGVTLRFTESAAVTANSPVLRIKMEANNPANTDLNKNYMLLGDYQLHLRHDPDGIPMNGDEASTSVFSFPGKNTDPSGFGSMAPSAELVIRDSAGTSVANLPAFLSNASGADPTQPSYSDYLREFSSLNATTKEAVWSGNYAPASGEYKPDGSAKMSDLNTATAAGSWDVTVDDPNLSGEGKVTDVRLKYNNNTKALIEGPDGVRLLNVKFEGMDGVEIRADLNNRILMSGTLVKDPNISKMVVKAGQKMEAELLSDATMKEVSTSAGDAQILAGVTPDPNNPGKYLDLEAGVERVLEMQTASIAGQLTVAAHTVVFNNANITSRGAIEVRTRDGMVNRTYDTVVPGTTSFMGASGNTFRNTAGVGSTMTIANSADIVGALSGGQMSENGTGGASMMNVGKLR